MFSEKVLLSALEHLSESDISDLLRPHKRVEYAREYLDMAIEARRSFDEQHDTNRQLNSIRRQIRLWNSRLCGSHDRNQWDIILKIFNHRCASCGCECIGGSPCKDHIIPISWGGSDATRNLQPLCRECNSSDNSYYDWRPQWLIDLLGKDSYGDFVEVDNV